MWRDHDDVHSHVPKGALLEVYQAVDAAVGTALEGVDTRTTTVVVCSLHGMGHNVSQERSVRRAMDRINASYRREVPAHDNSAPARRGLIRALRESIPAPVQHGIARAVPVAVRDWVVGCEVTGVEGHAWGSPTWHCTWRKRVGGTIRSLPGCATRPTSGIGASGGRSRWGGRVFAAPSPFVHSVRTGTPFAPGFADGLRNATWVAAAEHSAASGGA
jgi:hypothetical protein